MTLDVIGNISNIELIAAGSAIRERSRLRRAYGARRWRKLKGVATLRLPDGRIVRVEVHWYESHGIGKKELKIKRFLD